MKKKKVFYTQEFRDSAVQQYYTSGTTIHKVAEELGINHLTLKSWIQDAKKKSTTTGKPEPKSKQEQNTLKQLRELRKQHEHFYLLSL